MMDLLVQVGEYAVVRSPLNLNAGAVRVVMVLSWMCKKIVLLGHKGMALLYEPVSDSVYCEDVARLGRVGLQAVAQFGNVVVHRARGRVHFVAPHLI